MQDRLDLDRSSWFTRDPWFAEDRSGFCNDTLKAYSYTSMDPDQSKSDDCVNPDVSPPNVDCWNTEWFSRMSYSEFETVAPSFGKGFTLMKTPFWLFS